MGSLGRICLVQMSGKPKPTTSALSWFHSFPCSEHFNNFQFDMLCKFCLQFKTLNIIFGQMCCTLMSSKHICFQGSSQTLNQSRRCLHWQSPSPQSASSSPHNLHELRRKCNIAAAMDLPTLTGSIQLDHHHTGNKTW